MTKQNKICIGILMTALFIQFNATAQQQFVGNWKIAAEQSDFGGLDSTVAAPFWIDIKINDSLVVSRKFKDQKTVREVLFFGAKDLETFANGNTLKKARVNWSEDKKRLLFSWYFEVGGNEWHYSRTEAWSLSENGKILTIDRITILPEKTDKVKAVYIRE